MLTVGSRHSFSNFVSDIMCHCGISSEERFRERAPPSPERFRFPLDVRLVASLTKIWEFTTLKRHARDQVSLELHAFAKKRHHKRGHHSRYVLDGVNFQDVQVCGSICSCLRQLMNPFENRLEVKRSS